MQARIAAYMLHSSGTTYSTKITKYQFTSCLRVKRGLHLTPPCSTHILLMESNRSCASSETPTPLEFTSFHLASMFCSNLLFTRCRLISGRGGAGSCGCGGWERSSRSETCLRLMTCTMPPEELPSSSGVE